jgi:hypothetical protein
VRECRDERSATPVTMRTRLMSCERRTYRRVKWSKCATSCAKIAAVSSGSRRSSSALPIATDGRRTDGSATAFTNRDPGVPRDTRPVRSCPLVARSRRTAAWLRALEAFGRVGAEPDTWIPRFPGDGSTATIAATAALIVMSHGRSVPTTPRSSATIGA